MKPLTVLPDGYLAHCDCFPREKAAAKKCESALGGRALVTVIKSPQETLLLL